MDELFIPKEQDYSEEAVLQATNTVILYFIMISFFNFNASYTATRRELEAMPNKNFMRSLETLTGRYSTYASNICGCLVFSL